MSSTPIKSIHKTDRSAACEECGKVGILFEVQFEQDGFDYGSTQVGSSCVKKYRNRKKTQDHERT